MAEEKSLSNEIAGGLRSIFERVGEFFHIFDLSFFVSGAMTFGAFAYLFLQMRYSCQFPFAPWVGTLSIIVACYVCGLIAFAIGRELSGCTFRRRILENTLPNALEAHNLTNEIIAPYTVGEKPPLWWLYSRMWSEIAHEKPPSAIVHHLRRYWVMSATYDGVAFSFIVWAIALVVAQLGFIVPEPVDRVVGTAGVLLCACAAFFAFRRGASYYKYQIEDAVAHFAVLRCSLTTLGPSQKPSA